MIELSTLHDVKGFGAERVKELVLYISARMSAVQGTFVTC